MRKSNESENNRVDWVTYRGLTLVDLNKIPKERLVGKNGKRVIIIENAEHPERSLMGVHSTIVRGFPAPRK